MSHTPRIKLDDSLMDIVMKLSEGNIGAVTALMQLVKDAEKIDPDALFKEFAPLFALDTIGIYGPRIWMLWKDASGMNPLHAIALLRALQLGILTETQLNAIIDGEKVEFPQLVERVREIVPQFGRAEEAA